MSVNVPEVISFFSFVTILTLNPLLFKDFLLRWSCMFVLLVCVCVYVRLFENEVFCVFPFFLFAYILI